MQIFLQSEGFQREDPLLVLLIYPHQVKGHPRSNISIAFSAHIAQCLNNTIAYQDEIKS